MHVSAILTVLGSAALSRAHPTRQPSVHLSRRGVVDLDAFRLPLTANYTTSEETLAKRDLISVGSDDPVEVATAHAKKANPGLTFRLVDDHYTGSNGISHVRFKQTVHGIDIDNADFNVNVDGDGKVFSFGGNFYTGDIPDQPPIQKRDDTEGALDAVKSVTSTLGLGVDLSDAVAAVVNDDDSADYVVSGADGVQKDPKATVVYFVKSDGTLSLSWRVETDTGDNWLQSYIDKDSQEIHGVVDWVSDATYQVYPWGLGSPDDGGRTVVTDPWDKVTSEFTWIGDGKSTYTTTRGNNAIAQSNPSGGSSYLNNPRPSSSSLKFEYPFDLKATNPTSYVDASTAQLFYTSNRYHDVLYALGFTEAAGNFEVNNNGQGGKGNDFVILNTQDGSGTNNANFATPPDGSMPRMRMYIWDYTTPKRDSSFDSGVVIHEYTHGLSNRLTGGPANSNCLNALESGGMGEGWGDAMAIAINLAPSATRNTDYPMGSWVTGDPKGIRSYLYSTSLTTNPHTYADLDSLSGVHAIGTVWATMIYELLWNLIDKHGKSDAGMPQFNGKVPTDGKQPCNPSFIQARDAIIDADKALTGGSNACEIWKAFAKRGLGEGATRTTRRVNSTKVPSGVC
ncbi:probable Extracellular metalloproteinase MEP [Cephalotrichum gorgonifer]|uniref:Extracellular metalloproteinase n=1 Tax=Cephalotrichum gorgonifer TaxID=2041049 RepID=A0AAE8MW89_9PEZI|nr:probable Extracellular metalloproteinase MEP [Cephalotrichum gorgonifer]